MREHKHSYCKGEIVVVETKEKTGTNLCDQDVSIVERCKVKVDKYIIVANCRRYRGRREVKRLKAICIPQNPLLKCVWCHFVSIEVVDRILVAATMRESARLSGEAAISSHGFRRYT